MSRKLSSKVDWSTMVEEEETEQQVGPVVDQQPSDKKPKQEEPPTESQDVKPQEAQAEAGASEVQGPDPEAVLQEQDQPKTGGESSGVKYKILGKLEPSNIPERGEGNPPI
ncbi:unnamed protein product [Pipistrellus nathusii]|uniref:GAGE domain-containing protein n=1 Tax=Pipistrellus nathusii TaxID=59473 RepID=A0ABP0AHK6_PIPNA